MPFITDVITPDTDPELRRRDGETMAQFRKRLGAKRLGVDDAERIMSREWQRFYERRSVTDDASTAATVTTEDAKPEVIGGRAEWMERVRLGRVDDTTTKPEPEIVGGRAEWVEAERRAQGSV